MKILFIKKPVCCLSVIFLLFLHGLYAQDLRVSGKVIDIEGAPLRGVTVTVKESGKATATNEKGEFQLTVPAVQSTITFTLVGYGAKDYIRKPGGRIKNGCSRRLRIGY